jgi:hypothetical protein
MSLRDRLSFNPHLTYTPYDGKHVVGYFEKNERNQSYFDVLATGATPEEVCIELDHGEANTDHHLLLHKERLIREAMEALIPKPSLWQRFLKLFR